MPDCDCKLGQCVNQSSYLSLVHVQPPGSHALRATHACGLSVDGEGVRVSVCSWIVWCGLFMVGLLLLYGP